MATLKDLKLEDLVITAETDPTVEVILPETPYGGDTIATIAYGVDDSKKSVAIQLPDDLVKQAALTDIDAKFENYTTTAELNDMLSAYALSADVSATIEHFQTACNDISALFKEDAAEYVKDENLSATLAGIIKAFKAFAVAPEQAPLMAAKRSRK